MQDPERRCRSTKVCPCWRVKSSPQSLTVWGRRGGRGENFRTFSELFSCSYSGGSFSSLVDVPSRHRRPIPPPPPSSHFLLPPHQLPPFSPLLRSLQQPKTMTSLMCFGCDFTNARRHPYREGHWRRGGRVVVECFFSPLFLPRGLAAAVRCCLKTGKVVASSPFSRPPSWLL